MAQAMNIQPQQRIRLPKYTPLRMGDITNFSQNNLDVRHNNKFMNPAYVQNMLAQPKYQGWTFEDNRDLDNDGAVDSVIYDPQHQPVYFNGYYNIPNDKTLKKKDFYHDPNYQAQNWSNETFKEYRKSDYEIVLIRTAKEFRRRLKQYLKDRNLNADTIKITMKNIDGEFVKKFVNKYITIPMLIVNGFIQNVNIDQYEQALRQTIGQRDVLNGPLMQLYKFSRKVIEQMAPNNFQILSNLLDRNFTTNDNVIEGLFADFARNIDANTNKYPKAAKVNFGISFMRAWINAGAPQRQAQPAAPQPLLN